MELPTVTVTNPMDTFTVLDAYTSGSTLIIDGIDRSSEDPELLIGNNSNKYTFEISLDSAIRNLNIQNVGLNVKKSESLVFLNSEIENSGVEVYSNWPDLSEAFGGIWGQCASGSLPYLKAIVKKDPCFYDLSEDYSGNFNIPTKLLRLTEGPRVEYQSLEKSSAAISKLLLSGEKVDVQALKYLGFENVNPWVLEQLNVLTQTIPENNTDLEIQLAQSLEKVLIKAHFYDEDFKPSSKTFSIFGINGIQEDLIPEVLRKLKTLSAEERYSLENIEKISNQVLLISLISTPANSKKLSVEIMAKSGLISPNDAHAKSITRLVSKLPVSQLGGIEKIEKLVQEFRQKIESRTQKLRERMIFRN